MFIASGRILVLVAAFFSVKILIGKVLKKMIFTAFGRILVLVATSFHLK